MNISNTSKCSAVSVTELSLVSCLYCMDTAN